MPLAPVRNVQELQMHTLSQFRRMSDKQCMFYFTTRIWKNLKAKIFQFDIFIIIFNYHNRNRSKSIRTEFTFLNFFICKIYQE